MLDFSHTKATKFHPNTMLVPQFVVHISNCGFVLLRYCRNYMRFNWSVVRIDWRLSQHCLIKSQELM